MELNEEGEQSEKYQVEYLEKKHSPIVRELFQEVFNETMSEALWDWKYGNGTGCGTVVFKDGAAVAHYGAIIHDALYKGKVEKVIQIADVMVKKEARQAVRSNSAFFLAGKAFIEEYVGYNKRFLFGYGFPNTRAMRVAERVNLYGSVGKMCEVSYPVFKGKISFLYLSQVIDLNNFDSFKGKIETLWNKLKNELGDKIVPVKDAGCIKQRYLHHPEKDYTLHLLSNRFTGKPIGLIVLKTEHNRVLIMDIVGAFADFKKIINFASSLPEVLEKGTLASWYSKTFTSVFELEDAKIKELPITIPTNIWSDAPSAEELNDLWWLMAGDTDFL